MLQVKNKKWSFRFHFEFVIEHFWSSKYGSFGDPDRSNRLLQPAVSIGLGLLVTV
jgi:hypothetical protein